MSFCTLLSNYASIPFIHILFQERQTIVHHAPGDDTVMSHQKLTSAEIANLWNSYMLDTMVTPVLKYFLSKVDDREIKNIIQDTKSLIANHIRIYHELFDKEQFAIQGFSDDDVNVNAPRLFSDVFLIQYFKHMVKFALQMFSLSYLAASRQDIRDLYSMCMEEARKVDQKTTEVLKAKGLYVELPYIPTPKAVDFVKKQHFLAGFFSERRPLTAQEITELFQNTDSNAFGKAFLLGLSQVVQSKDVRQYFIRGKDIANKHIKIFSEILLNEDLAIPPNYDGEVLVSTESPFSDRLMMYHVLFLTQGGMGNYGMSMSSAQRHDLAIMYGRLMTEVGKYADDGANIFIHHGWMEQPPLAPDREALSNKTE
jgi:hypothetical protein